MLATPFSESNVLVNNKRLRGDSMESATPAKRIARDVAGEPVAALPRPASETTCTVCKEREARFSKEMELVKRLRAASPETRKRVVLNYNTNVRFMCVAVAVERQLAALADPSIASHPDILKLARRQVFGKEGLVNKKQMQPLSSAIDSLTWQDAANDEAMRKQLINSIADFLVDNRPGAPNAWIMRFTSLIPKLELKLYQNAASASEYSDMSNLQQRISSLYQSIRSCQNQTQFSNPRVFGQRNLPIH